MNIKDILDLTNLRSMMTQGYIAARKHPSLDIFIYNYTHNCQYDNVWNNVTETCRGLICDQFGQVYARPFKKFFNFEQVLDKIPNESFEAFKKQDGSLGILYLDFTDMKFSIATRGSFESDQAIEGTKIFREKYEDWMMQNWKVFENKTVLFEIIYPENRIVIDYAGLRDLVMLSVIDNETGKDVSLDVKVPWPVTEKYNGIKDLKLIKSLNIDNEEGFVILFESGFRCKVKFDDYMRLHRVLTGINEKDVWETLMLGKSMKDLVERVPDEFYVWIQKTEEKITSKFKEIEKEVLVFAAEVESQEFNCRRDLAIYIQKHAKPELRGSVFSVIDKKSFAENIWKMIRPVGPFKAFKIDEE